MKPPEAGAETDDGAGKSDGQSLTDSPKPDSPKPDRAAEARPMTVEQYLRAAGRNGPTAELLRATGGKRIMAYAEWDGEYLTLGKRQVW